MANHDRYHQFERAMTAALFCNTLVFILYLIAAAAGILWLKALLAVLSLLIPVFGLVILRISRELTKPRSLWLGCGFFAIAACTLASVILAYPG